VISDVFPEVRSRRGTCRHACSAGDTRARSPIPQAASSTSPTTVFAAGPPASILVYAPKPEAQLGWPRALRDHEKPYIAEAYRDLFERGRLTGRGGEANLERVLALKPDLIVDFASVRDTFVDLADRVQEQTGIPDMLVDGRL
jgi:iron complex transport system substrate-binding protein